MARGADTSGSLSKTLTLIILKKVKPLCKKRAFHFFFTFYKRIISRLGFQHTCVVVYKNKFRLAHSATLVSSSLRSKERRREARHCSLTCFTLIEVCQTLKWFSKQNRILLSILKIGNRVFPRKIRN